MCHWLNVELVIERNRFFAEGGGGQRKVFWAQGIG